MKRLPAFLFCALMSHIGTRADTLDFSAVRTDTSNRWQSTAIDPVTGKFYQRPEFGNEGHTVTEYNSAADFETGTAARTIDLQTANLYGTYATAYNGRLYGRTWFGAPNDPTGPVGSRAAGWNLMTGGMDIMRASFPNMTGINGSDTFDWGGYTGLNFFQDSTGIYMLGRDTTLRGNTWRLNHLDSGLNVLASRTFVADTIGFAVFKDGRLLTGASYTDNGFDHMLDFASGKYLDVDIDFTGLGGNNYLDNLLYDPNNDVLYAHNQETQTFYKAGGLAQIVDSIQVTVPEGGNYAAALALVCLAHAIISLRSAKS